MPLQTLRWNGTAWAGKGQTITPPPVVIGDYGATALGATSYAIPAGAIYVSPTGSDGAGGTSSAPKQTVTAALTAAGSGGTVVLRAGSYFVGADNGSGTFSNGVNVSSPVTIQNYPGEVAWFDGSQVITGWTFDSATGYWWAPYTNVTDRTATFTRGQADGAGAGTGAGGYFLASGSEHASWPDMILSDGTQLAQVQTKTALGPGKFWVEGANTGSGLWFAPTKVWVADDPTSHEMRAAIKNRSFAVTADNVTIRGVGFRRYATDQPAQGCLYFSGSDNSVMENVVFEDIHGQAWQFFQSDNCTATKITSRRTGFNSGGAFMCSNLTLSQFDIYDVNTGTNGAKFSNDGPSIAGMKFNKMQGIKIDRTRVKNVGAGSGIWFDQTCADPHVLRTWVEGVGAYGVDFEGSSGAIAADVLIKDTGKRGLYHNDTSSLRSWNVTVVNAMTLGGTGGQWYIGQSNRNPYDAQWSFMLDSSLPSGYYDNTDHQFHVHSFEFCNNVATMPAASAGGNGTSVWYWGANSDTWASGQTNFQTGVTKTVAGNLYWWQAQPQYPFVVYNYGQSATVYFSIAAVQSGQGIETNSTLLTGSGTNPLNAAGQVIDKTRHNKAQPLPSDIATLIGQPAGTRRVGAFIVGDPS